MKTKLCPTCRKNLEITEFEFKDKEKIRRSSWCKSCTRVYKKKHYSENRGRYLHCAYVSHYKKRYEIRKVLFEYFSSHPCLDCGETDPIVLEFDHRNPSEKKYNISQMVVKNKPLNEILDEVNKCDVRCANCHRRKTAKQFYWYENPNEVTMLQKRKYRNSKKELEMKSEVFQSRFGFHPCSRETSKQLRFLNNFYQKSLHRFKAWERWDRKAPHNRVKRQKIRDAEGRVIGYSEPVEWKEPIMLPIFTEQVTKKVTYNPKTGVYCKEGIDYTYWKISDLDIPAMAKQARKPCATPESVQKLKLSEEEINRLYEQAKNWLENN